MMKMNLSASLSLFLFLSLSSPSPTSYHFHLPPSPPLHKYPEQQNRINLADELAQNAKKNPHAIGWTRRAFAFSLQLYLMSSTAFAFVDVAMLLPSRQHIMKHTTLFLLQTKHNYLALSQVYTMI